MVAVSDHWRARPHPYLPAVSALRLGMAGRDLKLEFLTDTTVLKHKGPLRMQALQPVADAFLQNARRLVHMQSVPFLLAHALRAIERSEAGALMQLTGSIQPIEVDDPRAVQLRKIQIELYRAQIEEQKAEPKKKCCRYTSCNSRGLKDFIETRGADFWTRLVPRRDHRKHLDSI
jgi:hypothetical protein